MVELIVDISKEKIRVFLRNFIKMKDKKILKNFYP
jgi:hypothetical protein